MDFHSFQAHLSQLSSVKFSENISLIPDLPPACTIVSAGKE